MDLTLVVELIAFVIFLMMSAFFSSSETALTSITKFRIKSLGTDEDGSSPLDIWLHDPNRILATLLVGNNIANVGASILSAFIFKDLIMLAGYPEYEGIAGIGAFITTTVSLLIFGEIIPKIYAKQHSDRMAPRVIVYLNALYTFPIKPVVLVCVSLSNAFIKIAGGETSKEGPFLTEDDVRLLLEMSEREGVLEEEERVMIDSIIEFRDTIAKEVMVPRTDMVRLEVTASLEESLKLVVRAGHSRIPIFEEKIDNIIGILYAKDLLAVWHKELEKAGAITASNGMPPDMGKSFNLRKLLRPATFVPETKKVSELLREFQQHRFHMAVVVDEYGGTSGLVTIEDIVEEIVGEIQDEYDREGDLYRKTDDKTWEVDARMNLSDLREELEVDLPEGGDFDTLSGLISSIAGRVPLVGEAVIHKNWKMTVLSGDERHVEWVRIEYFEGDPVSTNTKASPVNGR
jgi:putative hemolysin